MHLPHPHLSRTAKYEPCALPPRKLTSIDKYATLSPSFSRWAPPFLGGLDFMVQARHFGKRLQWHRAGRNIYFSSPSALLPLLERSWGEEGGWDVASSCQPERRPSTPLLSSLPSLSSSSSLGFMEAGAFGTLERSEPSWKSQLATIRPFPLPARCAFVWVACLQESPFVGSFMLFFYEAKIGDKQVLRCLSQQVKILSLVLSRC